MRAIVKPTFFQGRREETRGTRIWAELIPARSLLDSSIFLKDTGMPKSAIAPRTCDDRRDDPQGGCTRRDTQAARRIPASSRCSQLASGPPPTRSAVVHDPALGSNRDKRFARTRFDIPASRFLDTAEKQDTKLISAPRRAVPLRKGLARYLGGVFPRSRGTGCIARFAAEHQERRSREIAPRGRAYLDVQLRRP